MDNNRMRIAIIDDEKPIRDWLLFATSSIKDLNLQIKSFSNGKEALDYLKDHNVDLILSDIIMPIMDGLQLLEQLRKNNIQTPFVLLTNYAEFDYAQRAISNNVSDYVLKADLTKESLEHLITGYYDELQTDGEISNNRYVNPNNEMNTLIQRSEQHVKQNIVAEPDSQEMIINKVVDYIEENYVKQITLADLAAVAYLTPQYLCRLFKEIKGENITHYITSLRLIKAKDLLRHTDESIANVGRMVGYNSPSYFTKIYKRYMGKMPSEERS